MEEEDEGTVSGLIFAIFSAFLLLTRIFSVGIRTEENRSEKENEIKKKQENEKIVNNVNNISFFFDFFLPSRFR